MNVFDVEIFEQTSSYCELRLSTGGGAPLTRGLDRAAVDELIQIVEGHYSKHAIAPRVFGLPHLSELGEKLFAFLDGDQRWLSPVRQHPYGAILRIAAAERLRHLPWELLAVDGSYLTVAASSPLLPVRAVGPTAAVPAQVTVGNRPLRVLFMASSPEHVEPVLNFEAEEAAILAATARTGTELVVEESGTLEGLQFLSRDYGEGYFDVLHLSGHATVSADGQPTFLAENELGGLEPVTAEQIAEALVGHWPRLVFVSGCLTANAPDGGTFPSMSESLVRAGAPTVLGWALPVGDVSATECAAQLYQALASGEPLDRAVVAARRHLYHARKSPNWHLLRVYADQSPLTAMVTPLNTTGRARIRVRDADQTPAFLDPQTERSRVASRATFVGRRRVIQRCLRALKQPEGTQALVLHGMGGLGKSSLASRLLERMPTHQRVVWYGRVDLTKLRDLTNTIRFPTVNHHKQAAELLADDKVPLAVRLRYLLDVDGPLGSTPCLFVFDDFEEGNLDERDGGYVLSVEMAGILPALLAAIRDTASSSRVIITSRYQFPAPSATHIVVESLETLTANEQTKKITNLKQLRPDSRIDPDIRDRAIQAAAGNPRLLDWLNLIVDDPTLDVDDLLTAIESETDRFRRETVLANNLLDSQTLELRRMLAKINVVELPIPAVTVHAIHDHPDTTRHIERAVQLGLIEEGTDPETGQARYYVSNVLRPLIRPLLTDDEHTEACAAAARSLYEVWVVDRAPDDPSS